MKTEIGGSVEKGGWREVERRRKEGQKLRQKVNERRGGVLLWGVEKAVAVLSSAAAAAASMRGDA